MSLEENLTQKVMRIELNLLRDYLRGDGTKDFSTLQTVVESILAKLDNPLNPIIAEVSPAKIVVQSFDSLTGATAEGAAANLALNTDHRGAGANSIEFDKVAGNVLAGVSYVISSLDLSKYSTHAQIDFFTYIPTPVGGTIVQAYAALGTDATNLFYWAIPVTDLTLDAWNHVMLNMMNISGVLGVGANLSAVTYCAIYVQTSVVGATIANVLVDQLVVKRAFEVNVVNKLATLTADGLTPTNVISSGGFLYIYDPVAGDWNRWRQSTTEGVPEVQDTGVNTNPERWLHDYHWEPPAEVTIAVAGAGGEQDLGAVVPVDTLRRIRELTIRHAGTNDTVVTLLISGGATKTSIDIPAGTTQQWSNQDGKSFDPAEQPAAQSSDVTGGNTYVSASGVEI